MTRAANRAAATRTGRFARLAAVALAGVVVAIAWHERHRVLLAQFHEVEPGRVYRGALQHRMPLERLIRTQGIRTILSLVGPCPEEQQVARELGVEWISIDLHHRDGDDAARAGRSLGEDLIAAAAIVAEPSKQPIYFHCYRGWDRSNLVHGAYRLIECGWSLEHVFEELGRIGFDPARDRGDAGRRDMLIEFHHERMFQPKVATAPWESQ